MAMSRQKWLRTAAAAALCCALAAPAAADEARARELINALGCKGCHRLGENGGSLAPPLDGVGRRLGPERIRATLVNPRGVSPGSTMPSYAHLPPEDLQALVDYLNNLK